MDGEARRVGQRRRALDGVGGRRRRLARRWVVHEPFRRHRRLDSRAAAEHRRADGEHEARDRHRARAADGHPRAPYRRRGRGLLHARARRGARRAGARGLCCGGPRHADRVEHQPPRRWPANATRAARERVAQGGARRPARDQLRHLQRLRGDDDRRLHPQRPDPTGPDPARDGRQRRVHLGAGAQCRPGGPHGDGRPARLADARRRRRRGDPRAGARGRSRDRGGRVHDAVRAQPPVRGVPGEDRPRGDDAHRCPGDP